MKSNNWYAGLTPLKQLIVSFIFYWFVWLVGSLLRDKIFYDKQHSWAYLIFEATWMAFFWTIFFNWTNVKALLKSNNHAPRRAHN